MDPSEPAKARAFRAFNPDDVYDRLIHEAPLVPGDDGSACQATDIEWLNPQLVREGQDFIRRNFFSITLAHVGALLYGFSFKCLTSVLLRTGGFGLGDSTKSMLRHIETELYINEWYEQDILAPNSSAFKSVQQVRKLHTNALRRSQRTPLKLLEDVEGKDEKLAIISAVRKDLDECLDTSDSPQHVLTYNPALFFSQFDMVMTQFGFFSLMFTFPATFGVRDTRGLEGFVHLWAVIGRMLGIQDRFNLGLYPCRDLHLKLFYKLGMASLKDMDLTILQLQETYSQALARMGMVGTLKSNFYFGLNNQTVLPGFRGQNLWALMGWWDKVCFKFMGATIFLMYHVDLVRRFLNAAYRVLSNMNQRKRAKKSRRNGEQTIIVTKLESSEAPEMDLHQRA